MWCCKTRKQIFQFEHGTMVKARDPYKAYEILSSISLKDGEAIIEETANGHWVVNFSPNIFTEQEALGPAQARRSAEWAAYLDRRELCIVAAYPLS